MIDMSMYLSLPRIANDAECEDLLQQHFEQEGRDANARWDDVL